MYYMGQFSKTEFFPSFKFTCEKCNFYSNNKTHYNKHLQTKKHNTTTTNKNRYCNYTCNNSYYKGNINIKRHKDNNTIQQNTTKKREFYYTCEKCNYKSNNKSHYKEHLKTKKHNTTKPKKIHTKYTCNCGKTYSHRGSLYNHKKICKDNNDTTDNNNLIEIIKSLLIQNNETTNKVLEQNSQLIDLANKPVINNTNCNNNNTFNLNTFLNVNCKDAINISDYINNIKVSIEDFENIHKNDPIYIYNKYWIQPLMLMDQTKRPIHCTDKKRKNFAVKDNDTWKRKQQCEQINLGIQRVMDEGCATMQDWKHKYPFWNDNDTYQEIINKSTVNIIKGYDDNLKNKIINKMCELTIDK